MPMPGCPSITASRCAAACTCSGRKPAGEPAGRTTGKVALFATCYMNRNEPGPGEDLVAVFEHNGIPVTIAAKERCCGMPKLELGDLEAVKAAKEANIPVLAKLVDEGWDLTALIPSCVLMFKQELPLMFPDDPDVQKVKNAFFDPFEYLMLRHKEGKLKTDFKQGWARWPTTPPAISACRTSGRRPGRCCRWCRVPRWRSSSAAPATMAPMR